MAKRQVLESRFEISTVVVGDGREEEVQETKVLNRILRMDHKGWQYEADQRHGRRLICRRRSRCRQQGRMRSVGRRRRTATA